VRSTEAASAARRVKGEESRLRLIEAATELIGERGYRGASVNDICRRAGVAKTALYWHFDDKEGLLAAVLEALAGRWIEELQKRAYQRALPHQRLEELVDGWREILETQPQLIRLPVFLQLEAADHSKEIQGALRTLFERSEQAIAHGLEDSLGRGTLADASAIAHAVMSLLEAVVARVGLARNEGERDAVYDALKRTIVQLVWAQLPEEMRAELVRAAPGLDPAGGR
jgi:AcrR family transcriptional regulator